MIERALVICLSAFLLGGVGLYVASRRVEPTVRRNRLIKFVTYFCIVNLVVVGAMAEHWIFSGIVLLIAALGELEIHRALHSTGGGPLYLKPGISAVYRAIAVGAILFAWTSRPEKSVFVYLIVCAFDGFSQVTGQMLGRHQLAPTISPGKTVEGSLGGLIAAVGMGVLLRPIVGWDAQRALLACCFIAVAGLAGDLLASAVKRRCGIKDFGNLLRGHGGVLDRFDSFLFASATWFFAAAFVQWFGVA